MPSGRSVLFVYEAAHLRFVADMLATGARPRIVALDLWVSEAMRAQDIEHVVLTTYERPFQHPAEMFARTNAVAREWHRIPEMAFFDHQGVSIAESIEICIELYLGRLSRIAQSIRAVIDAHPECTEILMPHSSRTVSWASSASALFEVRAFVDAASLVAQERNIALQVLGVEPQREPETTGESISWRRIALSVMNTIVRLLAPRKPLKAFVSDYWRYLAPYAAEMPDLEIVLMDRSEMRSISLAQIWKHRIRSIHPRDRISARIRNLARTRRKHFAAEWEARGRSAVKKRFDELMGGEVPWTFAEPLFSYIVESFSERIVADIEALRDIFEQEGINRVLERASVSAQHHFFALAQVAYTMGIPAIEVQHGNETIASYSLYSRLKCGYLAAYGSCMRTRMVRDHGYDADRIRPIGSPRFDQYSPEKIAPEERARRLKDMGLDPARPVVLYATITEEWYLYPSYFTSLEESAVFEALRDVQKDNPEVQYIFKFRSRYLSEAKRKYIERMFPDGSVWCTDSGDLKSVLTVSDALVAPRSTTMHEAVLQGIPAILFPVRAGDKPFVEFYGQGFPVLTSSESFREFMGTLLPKGKEGFTEINERTRQFLDREYSFDGQASERMREFVREELRPRPASDTESPKAD